MISPTLLVNVAAGRSNAGLLQVAFDLAELLGAAVIGVAASQPIQLDVSGLCYIGPDVLDEERAETDAEISAAEVEFRSAFRGLDVEWRSSTSFAATSDYIVAQARHADLLVTSMPFDTKASPTAATAGELIMRCGRPVLLVPQAPTMLALDRVVLAWQDTREARRAALDALSLLQRAAYVEVVEIAADEDMPAARRHVEDVAHWLVRHGVVAQARAVAFAQARAGTAQTDDAEQLELVARECGANLVVAGAYGHSRLREWAFGGFTNSLLQRDRCALLSH